MKYFLYSFLLFCVSVSAETLNLRIPAFVDSPEPMSGEVGWNVTTQQTAESSQGSIVVQATRVDGVGLCSLLITPADGTATSADYFVSTGQSLNWAEDSSGTINFGGIAIWDRPGEFQGNLTFTLTLIENGPGEDECSNETLVNDVITITIIDQDVFNDFPAGWVQPATLFVGGLATVVDSSVSYETATGWWTITHEGGQIWSTADDFRAPTYDMGTTSDFTLTACVRSSHPGSASGFTKAGIRFQESLAAGAANIYPNVIGVDGGVGQRLSRRASTGAITNNDVYSDSTPRDLSNGQGYRLELDRSLASWKAYEAPDCDSPIYSEFAAGTETWVETGDQMYAALACTVNDPADVGFTGTCVIGDVVTSTTSVDHSVGSVVTVIPTILNVNEESGTFNFTMQRSGGLSGALAVDWDITGGTCVAGTHYTDTSGQLNWANTVGGSDSDPITVIDIAGVQGAASCTIIITATINSGSDTLNNDVLTATWLDTDQDPQPPQTGSWSTQGASGCSDQYGSFDAHIPGMRGHGACTRGGFVPGTTVIRVSNTNTSGSGSFAAALSASCPKVVLFDVSGHVDMNTGEVVQSPSCNNATIGGASAPGQFAMTGGNDSAALQFGGNDVTIDHLIITSHGRGSNPGSQSRDAINTGWLNGGNANKLFINMAVIWGWDEDFQCYDRAVGDSQTGVTLWQSIIGLGGYVDGGSATVHQYAHMNQYMCLQSTNIRNVYIHSDGRTPFTRGDGLLHANNVTFNSVFQNLLSQPCGSVGSSVPTYRVNVINNLSLLGPDHTRGAAGQFEFQQADCKTGTVSIYEDSNAVQTASGQAIANCNNHGCSWLASGNSWASSPIAYASATGYIPESFDTSSDAEITAFTNQVLAYVGPRPASRISYLQTRVIDAVEAGLAGGAGQGTHVPMGETIMTSEGGFAAITGTGGPWDPTAQGTGYFSGGMPTGAAADVIEASGYTTLHEWYICTHMDNVHPSGWREDKLTRCTAP